MLKLFLVGLLMTTLVSSNTRQVAQGRILGSFLVGFGISMTWAYAVHAVAIGGVASAAVYALGAACGTVAGILITKRVYRA